MIRLVITKTGGSVFSKRLFLRYLHNCFQGASSIQCCYAAIGRCESSTLTKKLKSKNANVIFCGVRNAESYSSSIVKPTARLGCFFQPMSHRVPCDSLYARDCGLVQALNTQGSNFVKGYPTVLEPMVGRAGILTECLSARPASVTTTLSPLGFAESVADNACGSNGR